MSDSNHSHEHHHHHHGGHHGHHRKKNKLDIKKLIVLFQLLPTIVLEGLLYLTGLFPVSYIAGAGILFLIGFALPMCLQIPKKKWINLIGVVLSVVISIGLLIGCFFLYRTYDTMQKVGGADVKTDNMVVVVKSGNQATNLLDTKDYRFGYQTMLDQENTEIMIMDVESRVGRELKTDAYDDLVDMANGLLDGKSEALIYNEAFTDIIEESIEGYSDQVRVVYHYGIDTPIKKADVDTEKPFHVYISGIDVSGPITTNSRSDVNVIMTVNPNTKKILLTSTPRDYYVPIPEVSGGVKDKLTHAGIYGVDRSMATLEALYGIDISYYARVNFTSLVTIVDALGGVDVESAYEFSSKRDGKEYHFNKGKNHLNGEEALVFSRERYSFQDGDNQRGRNQQAVLTAILNKAMSPAILMNATSLIDSVSGFVETNMTSEEMAKFINRQLAEPSKWSIESIAATGIGEENTCFSSGSQLLYVMKPDEAIVGDISRKMNAVLEGK